MPDYLMALDQGTTSSRCLIFDRHANIVASAQMETRQYYPRPGWVEQDPMEIWSSQLAVMTEARAKCGIDSSAIAGLGISNQRETTIVWDKTTGKPIHNAIVWQCRRTSEYCDFLKKRGLEAIIREKTGLPVDAYFSATKIRWLLDNVDGARARAKAGELLFGTVDTWLLWNLTHGALHATDCSNASRTMLYNIHSRRWDMELLRELDIPEAMLPEVKPSSCRYGVVSPEVAAGGVTLGGVAGDQQAALFGQCCHQPGMVKNTYGTGCFILMNTGRQPVMSEHGLLTTIAWGLGDDVEYALEGSVFIAGAAVQWLRDGLRMVENSAATEAYAAGVPDANGVYVVPAFVGLGAPYWDQHARGVVTGLTQGVTKEHFIRATLESLAYQSYDVVKAMQADSGLTIGKMRVDGGASVNDFLMQFQADILDAPVVRPPVVETTALGAAGLAGLAVGVYNDVHDLHSSVKPDKTFTPAMSPERRLRLLAGWADAVSRCLTR